MSSTSTGWAVLGQPYQRPEDDLHLRSAAVYFEADLTIEAGAPYGFGTWAVLLEGRQFDRGRR